jgi:hypothetical protein
MRQPVATRFRTTNAARRRNTAKVELTNGHLTAIKRGDCPDRYYSKSAAVGLPATGLGPVAARRDRPLSGVGPMLGSGSILRRVGQFDLRLTAL